MIQFIYGDSAKDAEMVMNNISRFIMAEDLQEKELLFLLPEIEEEMLSLRRCLENDRIIDPTPCTVNSNKIKQLLKKVIRKLTLWMIRPIAEKQTDFNGRVIQYLDLLNEKNKIVERYVTEKINEGQKEEESNA